MEYGAIRVRRETVAVVEFLHPQKDRFIGFTEGGTIDGVLDEESKFIVRETECLGKIGIR